MRRLHSRVTRRSVRPVRSVGEPPVETPGSTLGSSTASGGRSAGDGGFTLIELLVVLAILGIVSVLGIPALLNSLHRAKVEGAAQQVAAFAQRARLEAIKRNRQTMLRADTTSQELFAFVDANGNRVQDADEDLLGRFALPALVSFRGAPEGTSDDKAPVDGFGGNPGPVFEPNGSVLTEGAIRVGDERGNVLEVRVVSAASGRMEIRKWLSAEMVVSSDPLAGSTPADTDAGWFARGEERRGWVWN